MTANRSRRCKLSPPSASGVFSVRQVILGRVFNDVDANNSFNPGDKPLAGVRLYLTNGQSATTDSQGMYNFPAVDDGSLVISLDPITLPAGSQLLETGNKRDHNSWTRLLRTPLGSGGLLRQNFALRINASAVAENINQPHTANALVDNNAAPNAAPQSGVVRERVKESSKAETRPSDRNDFLSSPDAEFRFKPQLDSNRRHLRTPRRRLHVKRLYRPRANCFRHHAPSRSSRRTLRRRRTPPEGFGNYTLGGIDIEKSLPNKGTARFEFATSRGTLDLGAGFLNSSLTPGDEALTRTVGQAANGNAFRFELYQPLGFYQATLRADYTRTGGGFFNPFGSTQAAGSSRAAALFDMRPRASSTVCFSFTNERNQTANVDNSRTTVSALYTEQLNDKLRLGVGFDHREFNDATNDRDVSSNLLTVGAEYRPTDKLEITAKREQNLGDADPTYPDATTLTARYQINSAARLFFTQRLASAPIVPIADLVSTGFAGTGSRRETAFGIETNIGRATAVNGRYQIENGINDTDSFAVIGLTNRLAISKQFALDTAFERGFLLAGNGESFTGGSFGFGWQAGDNFRSSARYEIRDRNGLGQIFTLGAAGKIGDDITTLARFQLGRTTTDGGNVNGATIEDRHNSVMQVTAALAYRPLHNDRAALLFSYTHRSLEASGIAGRAPVNHIADTLSADGLYEIRPGTEFYGRFALRRSADGRDDVAYVSTMTYMTQARLAHRLGSRFDVAGEARYLFQPVTGSYRKSLGAEIGYWIMPDLRIGGGYNLTSLSGSATSSADNFFGARRGFYFTISSKLSNLFNLFGTSRAGLDGTSTTAVTPATNATTTDTIAPSAAPQKEED